MKVVAAVNVVLRWKTSIINNTMTSTSNIPTPLPLKHIHYLFSLLSGASLTLAFAPIEYRFFAIIAPAVLFGLLLKANTLKQH